ncbi:MAG: hypothetical protein GY828_07555 [Candidatus Gracilibacteria bacterium]|nr:hypothetical protein [Candidatus Gracilibacteria bacterium]
MNSGIFDELISLLQITGIILFDTVSNNNIPEIGNFLSNKLLKSESGL